MTSCKKSFVFLLLSFLVLITQVSLAQENSANTLYLISGKIYDEAKNPIENVGIRNAENKILGVSSLKGVFKFNLEIPDKSYKVFFSHTGFQNDSIVLSPENKNIKLTLKYLTIREVAIKGNRKNETTLEKLNSKAITEMPTPSGEFVTALLASQSGVAVNNELSSAYSVRGGSYDENLIYVNGIEIYRPFLVRAGQQEGLSFINPNLVREVSFSAGGFEASYGDKLASVLDVEYKTPSSFSGSAEGGLLGGSAHVEGKKDKLQYVAGARYRKNSNVLKGLDEQGEYEPRFMDFQWFSTYTLNPSTKIGVLGIYSSNLYRFRPKSRTTELGSFQIPLQFTVDFSGQEISSYNSGLAALSLQKQINPNFTLQVVGSSFITREREEFDIVGQYSLDEVKKDLSADDFGEVVQNYGVGGFLNHARNNLTANVNTISTTALLSKNKHYFKFGLEGRLEQVEDKLSEWVYLDSADYAVPRSTNTIEVNDLIKAKNNYQAFRFSAFIQDEITFPVGENNQIKLNLGSRVNYHEYTNEFLISPRTSFAFTSNWKKQLSDSTSVNKSLTYYLAGGFYQQPPFYREARGLDGGLTDIVAQKSIHFIFGTNYDLLIWGRPFKLRSEVYYKLFTDLIPYKLDNIRIKYFGNNAASGSARGIDLKLNGEFIPNTESWASLSVMGITENLNNDSYTNYFNATGDQINSLTGDQTVVDSTIIAPGNIPRPTDQRVQFGLFFRDEMPRFEDFKVQLSFIFGTGLPYGPPGLDRYKDTLRTPSYKRIDIGFSKDFITAERPAKGFLSGVKTLTLFVEVFNLIDFQNTVNYQWIKDVNGIQFAVPNHLTGRRLNVKLRATF